MVCEDFDYLTNLQSSFSYSFIRIFECVNNSKETSSDLFLQAGTISQGLNEISGMLRSNYHMTSVDSRKLKGQSDTLESIQPLYLQGDALLRSVV